MENNNTIKKIENLQGCANLINGALILENIKAAAMKSNECKTAFVYLMLTDKKARNVATISAKEKRAEKIKETPVKKRNAEQREELKKLESEILVLKSENESVQSGLDWIGDVKIPVISAVWAYSAGCKKLELTETAVAGLKNTAKELQKLAKEHNDYILRLIDESEKPLEEDQKYSGTTYREFKRKASELLTELYAEKITANRTDAAALLSCIVG